MTVKMITIMEFEQRVEDLEGICLVIRGSLNRMVEDYPFVRQAHGQMTVQAFLKQRVQPHIDGLTANIVDPRYMRAMAPLSSQTMASLRLRIDEAVNARPGK